MYWLFLIPLASYLVIMLRIYRFLRRIEKFDFVTPHNVQVSVIIPCRNESDNIGNILHDLAAQVYPPDAFEVIVVDDNSEDRTPEIVSGFKGIKNLTLLRNSLAGKKMAIKTGVEAANGELIITTDADCRAGDKWIRTLASFHYRYKSDLTICPVSMSSGSGFFGRFQELEFLALQGVTAGSAAGNFSTMCNGANLAFTKSAYVKHSANLHYKIDSGDDIFLLQSLKHEKGSEIRWLESNDAVVSTSQAKTIVSFLSQRKRWISKATAYDDRFTMLLGIVTFVTILCEITLMIASVFNLLFLTGFLIFFLAKSVPDFLILRNTAWRYDKKNLMKWFLPSGLIYPFYVLAVVCYPGRASFAKQVSYPFQKGI
jgi:cellulose synthase/poly-beta-1,6-N-acetylglucosamine synthase-like glycosyltransferase